MAFAKNFVLAFLGFFALGCVIAAVSVGPIALMVWLGVQPFPYGIPIVVTIYCALGAVVAAALQAGQP